MYPFVPLTRDPLTDLPDRFALVAHLEREMQGARCEGSTLALLLVTLDGLAAAVASLGQVRGDQLLVNIGTRLGHTVRKGDLVARWDKNTFAFLLLGVRGDAEITAVAWRVILICNNCGRERSGDTRLSACLGYARYPEHGQTPEALIVQTEVALRTSATRRYAPAWQGTR